MINKLHRRKRNTTGFLKTFFTHFWNFVVEQSEKHPKFKVFEEHSNEFNHLANSLDLVGKVGVFSRTNSTITIRMVSIFIQIFISLSSHSEYFTHIVTKIRSSPNLDAVFKANSLKFMGVPPVRDMAKTIHDEKPKFHSKPFSDIFLNGYALYLCLIRVLIIVSDHLTITIHHCRLCRAYKENRTAQKWIVMAAQTVLASITKKSIEFIGKTDVNPMMILFLTCSSKCKTEIYYHIYL